MTDTKFSRQGQLVLDYLKSGRALTNLIALTNLGVGSLTSRVAELRKAGVEIQDEWSFDHWQRAYKKYWMEKAAP
ncbi:MAG: helix-turn-helix domain-containing protein [Pseudomonadota bacterium]